MRCGIINLVCRFPSPFSCSHAHKDIFAESVRSFFIELVSGVHGAPVAERWLWT